MHWQCGLFHSGEALRDSWVFRIQKDSATHTYLFEHAESLRNLATTAQEQLDNGETPDALMLLEDATRRIQNPDEDDILNVEDIA